jgi:hypothetical protein
MGEDFVVHEAIKLKANHISEGDQMLLIHILEAISINIFYHLCITLHIQIQSTPGHISREIF